MQPCQHWIMHFVCNRPSTRPPPFHSPRPFLYWLVKGICGQLTLAATTVGKHKYVASCLNYIKAEKPIKLAKGRERKKEKRVFLLFPCFFFRTSIIFFSVDCDEDLWLMQRCEACHTQTHTHTWGCIPTSEQSWQSYIWACMKQTCINYVHMSPYTSISYIHTLYCRYLYVYRSLFCWLW